MKLVRFGNKGQERPGLVDGEGRIRDLSGHVQDFSGEGLSPATLERLGKIDPASLPLAPDGARLGSPVGRVGNFIAVGLNYVDHAHESNLPIPQEPILFNKAPSSLAGPNDAFAIPPGAEKVDWEVEIAIVIGSHAYRLSEADALSAVAGYAVCNDVSERAHQAERGGQWMKGKSHPGFGPLGPWLVTKDEVPDPQNLRLWLEVNGKTVQDGNTASMIFAIPHLVHYISQFMALEPGDVITTGTPPGVGMGMKPQRFLQAGDTVRLGIDGLGEQRQSVIAG